MSNLIGGGGNSTTLAILEKIKELENKIKELQEENKNLVAALMEKVKFYPQNGFGGPRVSLYRTADGTYYLQMYFTVNGVTKFVNLANFKM